MSYFDFSNFEISFTNYIKYILGKQPVYASKNDLLNAVSYAVGKYLTDISYDTQKRYQENDAKRLHYLSLEFLIGRLLSNNLLNLGIYKRCKRFLEKKGIDLDLLVEEERDPALGNGGLGRLAACFLDSLACLNMPGFGYGINYDYGLFKQVIVNGYQKEKPDYWPNRMSPWLIRRTEERYMVPIYGRVEGSVDRDGEYNPTWTNWSLLIGRPHDILVAGFEGRTVNYLRLFTAEASEDFDIDIFNDGDYFKAVGRKIKSETISKILYPSDSQEAGKELRLVQEYFLVACSLKDIIRKYEMTHDSFDDFHRKVAIQLNDTHPALAVAELMRILVDEKGIQWETAWETTKKTLGYTNHTLLPEALETWPVSILERVVPRHMQLIYEINLRFLEYLTVRDPDIKMENIAKMSIIQEGPVKQVRMANLAIIGSHSVNGVAKVHSDLVKTQLVPEFYRLWPERFNNKTNGVSPRRWIAACNRGLADFITEAIGRRWVGDLSRIWELETFENDPGFLDELGEIKLANKKALAALIRKKLFLTVDPQSIFDIHAKRIHEYKRQLLNVLHIIHLYLSIKEDGKNIEHPRTFIFSGKAAPGYHFAKLIIKLIHSVANVINKDPDIHDMIKVVFLPDYRVTLAEKIIPAADVSEQISTAGMEASGTGNMKFAMNGALTIGTLDGANIEIADQVGKENIYIFGLTVKEVEALRPTYEPKTFYDEDEDLKRVLKAIYSNMFCPDESGIFKSVFGQLMGNREHYLHLADFRSYVTTQQRIGTDYKDRTKWLSMSLKNIARTGMFSSDRAIQEYADGIWGINSYTD
ncbi:glycogen/starch/alpha-glucan phosphorylase [uncultured Desulfobacter sp.]|uniref:glycogen/starch/alpha-glucan phosphorylase n=1 Tax=uncultured Desulfobacter sp. TaxID=240139 RepID=UPI002AAAA63E|nr:glycogen/starch/alpha-glucan phosphorylase [uncultured Desulfobacter sp.]